MPGKLLSEACRFFAIHAEQVLRAAPGRRVLWGEEATEIRERGDASGPMGKVDRKRKLSFPCRQSSLDSSVGQSVARKVLHEMR
jgi:hypothetical protein